MIDALSHKWGRNKKQLKAKRRAMWGFFIVAALMGWQSRAHGFARPPSTDVPTPKPTPSAIASASPKPSVSPSVTPSPKPSVMPSVSPSPQPTSNPGNGNNAGIYRDKIMEIASTSACAKVSWKNRGRAPAGYMKGMALTYARSLCRQQKVAAFVPAPGALMSRASVGNTAKDALAHYGDVLANLQMPVNQSNPDTLRALYTLGLGLGMRESSGKYCTGYDTTAATHTANGSEAGLFQASYDSMGATPELRQLYNEYKSNPQRCHLDVFKAGVSCSAQEIVGVGTPGGEYQAFNKACPAFAAEYAMTLIRVLRAHFGPINRKEAEILPACEAMLGDVEGFLLGDVGRVCADL